MSEPCPKCGHRFDWMRHFDQEDSGKGHNYEFGQTEYWFSGTVTCPECRHSWSYGDSSL